MYFMMLIFRKVICKFDELAMSNRGNVVIFQLKTVRVALFVHAIMSIWFLL